jgi:hypothetical protein
MPKNSVVASFVGNFSPVKRRRAIFVRRTRHFRGDMGDELKRRAGTGGQHGNKGWPSSWGRMSYHLGKPKCDPT